VSDAQKDNDFFNHTQKVNMNTKDKEKNDIHAAIQPEQVMEAVDREYRERISDEEKIYMEELV
jgi:hypothetical protein